MSKYLVILESPNKVGKVKSFLGKDFEVTATKGHIRDLPEKKIGVNIKKDFEPTYEIYSDKKEIVKNILKMAKGKEIVYLMTDLDREGEYIAYHVLSQLKEGTIVKRAKSGSITKKAVEEAIRDASDLDYDLVNSAETRRILDRIVGWKCSFITKQATGGTSAGRVQSATLRILAEREKEIRDFVPQEYWPIEVVLEKESGEQVVTQIKVPDKLKIKNKKEADKICKAFKDGTITVSKYEVKESSSRAYAPFTTSTMYQSSSSILGWGADKTASVAQSLYEQGLCLLEDELITLADGSIVPIKHAKKYIGQKIKAFNKIKSDNFDLKIKDSFITDFQKIKYQGDILSIRTLDGQEISVTPDHKLLIYKDESFKWVESKDISEGDFILCAKNIKCNRQDKNIHIIDLISQLDDNIISKILVGFSQKDKEIIEKVIIKNKDKISTSTYYKYKKNLKVPLKWMLSNKKNITFLKKSFEYFQWQSPGSKKEKIDPISFVYFLGLCLGDGHICKSKSMVTFPQCIGTEKDWEKISQGIVYEQNMNFQKTIVQFSGKILYELCCHFGGYAGYKCDKIYIHPYISSLSTNYIYNFLGGLFDSDGCIKLIKYKKNQKVNVSYTSISQNMLKQINVLLRTLNHRCSLHRRKGDVKNGSIKIWEDSIYDFLTKIQQSLIVKQKDVKEILSILKNKKCVSSGLSKNNNYPIIDIIEKERKKKGVTKQFLSQYVFNNNGGYWAYLRCSKGHKRSSYLNKKNVLKINEVLKNKYIDDIINGDEYFAVVSKIQKNIFDGYVYDISTSTENFIANSFYSHNCTYIRSDSTFIVPDFIQAIRTEIPTKYGSCYLPTTQNRFSNKSNAQEAHEAIRVTDITHTMSPNADEGKLYTLIQKRTIASQMADMKQLRGVAEFKCDKYKLSVTGSKVIFDGWRKAWDYGSLDNTVLPEFKVGEKVKFISSKTEQKFTQPPHRYTDQSIIKELERLGIGRPSTYSTTIKTLVNRKYIEKQSKAIHVTDIGVSVSDFLILSNFCFIDLQFTANLETKLDSIASGNSDKIEILKDFWERLKSDIENASKIKDNTSKTDFSCPKCDGKLILKHSRYGKFLTCENRTNKESPCDYKCDVDKNGQPKEKEVKVLVKSDFSCPNCGEKLVVRINKKGGEYLGCVNWQEPKCKGFYNSETGELIVFKKKTYKKKYKKKGKKEK